MRIVPPPLLPLGVAKSSILPPAGVMEAANDDPPPNNVVQTKAELITSGPTAIRFMPNPYSRSFAPADTSSGRPCISMAHLVYGLPCTARRARRELAFRAASE